MISKKDVAKMKKFVDKEIGKILFLKRKSVKKVNTKKKKP